MKPANRGGGSGTYLRFLSPLAIVLLVVLFSALSRSFFTTRNIANILSDIGPLLFCSMGVSFVLLVGAIDLSIGSIISCSCILLTVTMPILGVWSYPLTILMGVAAGLVNGWIYTRYQIPSFIVTLGTMGVWQSIAYLIAPAPVLIPRPFWPLLAWARFSHGVVSTSIVASIVGVALCLFLQRKTETGLSLYAIGANETAARLAGLNVVRAKILSFVLCGFFCSLTGILLTAKLRSGTPTVGEPFGMLGIAAVCLGGASLSGGKGTAVGTLMGVLLVIIIQNGMALSRVDAFWQSIVFGGLIIVAICLTTERKVRNLVVK